MSNATAMVTDVFPVERRGKGLGINSMVISSGALLGPIVGGFLVNESWRWVFWFNVPFGVLLFFWGWRLLPNRLPKREKHDWHSFDLIGTVSLLSGLVGVLGAITYGTMMHAGGMAVLLLLLLGFSSFSVFIWQEQRAVNPIVRFDMFRQRTYSIANITTFFNAFARMSVPFILIFYLQGLRGFSPLQSGLAIIPMAAAMTLVGPYSGILADRIGARIPASMGLLISAVGLFSLGFISAETPVAYLIVSLAFVGCGSALFLAPNVMSIMNIVPPEYRGVAAGTRTMLNNFGTLFSLSVSVALLGQVIPESGLFGQQEVSQAQSEAFLFTVRVLFIGGGAVSVLAACLSWLREPDR